MGCSNDAGVGIFQQDRRAIGGYDAQSYARSVGYHRVGAWTLAWLPRDGNMLDMDTVDLCQANQTRWFDPQRAGDARAIFPHRLGVILTGDTAIEACERTGRHTAAAGKEAVRHGQAIDAERFGHVRSILCPGGLYPGGLTEGCIDFP